ncbi:hypothetical protein BDD12DRAFT_796758 [Trichophaea hybrida]|nr:hypothetical protein BDD12DRAFT_796758 [Trichophaea hybrida]
MAHPNIIRRKKFFYPIGNTPAVCLNENMPPESPANILLLGCGDPRNILFTLYLTEQSFNSKLDFTCCDVEPAVLSRNVLLFTLLADDTFEKNKERVWNIFYHFYLDQLSLQLLQSQCKRLLEFSKDIGVWNKSPYAKYLRMCTEDTLAQLNLHWQLYLNYKGSKKSFDKQIADIIKSSPMADSNSKNTTGARSAGPLWMYAQMSTALHFEHFWKHGVTYSDPKAIAAATLPNPAFACASGENIFIVHYGSDPLLGFHLAPALKSALSGGMMEEDGFDHLTAVVKNQFYSWSNAFRSAIASGLVMIRSHVGGALSFCGGLHHRSLTESCYCGHYTAQWSANPLILDGDYENTSTASCAPLLFDVIDTSNLCDHVGLLNILIASAPLISRSPFATIVTEMLISNGKNPYEAFTSILHGDISTISLLLDLVPQTFLSGFATNSNIHEIIGYQLGQKEAQFHERLAWKIASLGESKNTPDSEQKQQSLVFDHQQLAEFLFRIYLKMFVNEDVTALFRDINLMSLQSSGIVHYTRQTFAGLLRLVKSNSTQTDWKKLMGSFLCLVEQDRTLLTGTNNYQDLCLRLHISGVHSVIPLLSDPTEAFIVPGEKKGSVFEKWSIIPSTVFIALEVPREKLKALTDMDINELKTPTLHCEILTIYGHNFFSSIQTAFGELSMSGPGDSEDTNIILAEDSKGWAGTAPLFAFFEAPAWILLHGPQKVMVSLSIKSMPAYTYLTKILGMELKIFSANLVDRKSVRVSSQPPNITVPKKRDIISGLQTVPRRGGTTVVAGFNESAESISTLAIKVDVIDAKEKTALAGGAAVTVRQVSAYTMAITFAGFKKELIFPYPINGSQNKLRIARKSSYVEVIVPPAGGPSTPGGFSLNRFPIMLYNGTSPTPWNIHSLRCLNKLPILDTKNSSKWDWFTPHVSLAFSDRERAIRENQPDNTKPAMVNIKDTMLTIFLNVAGTQGPQRKVFGLRDPENGGINTVIFVTGFRLDLAAHTVIADSYILPLNIDIVMRLSHPLSDISRGMVQITVVGDEQKAWSELLPALVERCRDWKHTSKCEYRKKGVPVTYKIDESPLCSCGVGKKVGSEFGKVAEWKPFVKLVTRAAISPLFAISYVEPVGDLGAAMKRTNRCFGCRKEEEDGAKLMTCSRCKVVRYCSATCQKADWKKHKLTCKK